MTADTDLCRRCYQPITVADRYDGRAIHAACRRAEMVAYTSRVKLPDGGRLKLKALGLATRSGKFNKLLTGGTEISRLVNTHDRFHALSMQAGMLRLQLEKAATKDAAQKELLAEMERRVMAED